MIAWLVTSLANCGPNPRCGATVQLGSQECGPRPASALPGRVRCYNVAYENDVCPRIAHQHVEARTRGSRGRSNRDREAWRTRCGVASSKFSAAHGRCKEGADLRFHAKSLGSHAAS